MTDGARRRLPQPGGHQRPARCTATTREGSKVHRSVNGSQDAPTTRRPGRLSRWLIFALVLIAGGMAIRALAPQTIGETARRHVLSLLQDHYRQYTVSIRRGHFDPKVGLIFEDVRIWDSVSSASRPREMIRIDRITLVSDVHPERLWDKQNPLETKKILMDGVQANVWLEDGKTLSLTRLMPLPQFGPGVPEVEMRRIAVRLYGDDPGERPVDAALNQCVILKSTDAQGRLHERIVVRGSTDFADELLVVVNRTPESTDVRCAVKRAFLSRDLLDRLPRAWAEPASQAQQLQCNCDAQLAYFQRTGNAPNFRLRVNVHDGRFMHAMLPMPVSDLRGILVCEPSGITIESSQGMLGDAVLRSTGRIQGLKWPCDAELSFSARGLLLDSRLAASLPLSLQRGWNRLEPHGRIDLDAKLAHDGLEWTTRATLDCKGVDVRYDKFPYPVENLVGQVLIEDNVATSSLISGRIGGSRRPSRASRTRSLL